MPQEQPSPPWWPASLITLARRPHIFRATSAIFDGDLSCSPWDCRKHPALACLLIRRQFGPVAELHWGVVRQADHGVAGLLAIKLPVWLVTNKPCVDLNALGLIYITWV